MDVIEAAARNALAEDEAWDDATSLAVVGAGLHGTGAFVARQPGVAAGFPVAAAAFRLIDPRIQFEQLVSEGAMFPAGAVLAEVRGPARGMLQAERIALNFVQRLCATATMTRAFVDAVTGTGAVILDTRKTTPGMRELEKYAVRCGGGVNHRATLGTMAMIKDNHREALARAGHSLGDGVRMIRERTPGVPVEVEVDGLGELEAALDGEPEWILLDNMSPADMAEAVRRTGGRAKLEASGGINLETVLAAAKSGVDAVSVGAVTHSAGALDISLDLRLD